MASSSSIFVRIDSNIKQDAEIILRQLGVTPSSLITMLYHKVILTGGIPFDVRLPVREPIASGKLTEEEILEIVKKGQDDVKEGRVLTLEEAEKIIKDKYGF